MCQTLNSTRRGTPRSRLSILQHLPSDAEAELADKVPRSATAGDREMFQVGAEESEGPGHSAALRVDDSRRNPGRTVRSLQPRQAQHRREENGFVRFD